MCCGPAPFCGIFVTATSTGTRPISDSGAWPNRTCRMFCCKGWSILGSRRLALSPALLLTQHANSSDSKERLGVISTIADSGALFIVPGLVSIHQKDSAYTCIARATRRLSLAAQRFLERFHCKIHSNSTTFKRWYRLIANVRL
jgi:hypothetical protein